MSRAARRDRWLRSLVLRARGCLGALPRPQRRVLLLRAGVGRRAPLSRGRVARILHVRVRTVARRERKGLRALRRNVRSGGCPTSGAAAGGDFRAPGGARAERVSSDATGSTSGMSGTAPAGSAGNGRLASAQRAGAQPSRFVTDRGGVAGAAAIHETGGGFDPVVPLVLAVLAASALVLGRRLRPTSERVPGRREWPPPDDG